MMDDRFNSIEEVLAHQEKQLHELSEMVSDQWKEIDILKNQARLMKDKIKNLEESQESKSDGELSVSEMAEREKPPHY